MDGSAVPCSAAGRACFESAFPVQHSGIFWADCCADSDYCEVSFPSTFCSLYWLLSRFWFLCLLTAVGCCCILDGLVLASVMVGRFHYDGQRGFDACWVIACSW